MCEVESSGDFPCNPGGIEEGGDPHVRVSKVSDEVMKRMLVCRRATPLERILRILDGRYPYNLVCHPNRGRYREP